MSFIHLYFLLQIFVCFVWQNFGELITDEKEAWQLLLAEDEARHNSCLNEVYLQMDTAIGHKVAWQNFTDPLVKRAFELTTRKAYYMNEHDRIENLSGNRTFEIWLEKRNILSNTAICSYETKDARETGGNCTTKMFFDVINIFRNSENEDELKYYWVAWSNAVGKMRGIYDEHLQILKRFNLLPDYNDWWLHYFEEPASRIREELERSIQEILPLYKELHAYVRRRLIQQYSSKEINDDGPIPYHLVGILDSSKWYVNTSPYPEQRLNIAGKFKEKNITLLRMFKIAEDFYHSLGLPYIDHEFWNDVNLKSEGLCDNNIYFHYTCETTITGVSGCIPIIDATLHWLTGILAEVYLLNVKRPQRWPDILKDVPNPAFRYALRYVTELSAWTTDYLSEIGIIENIPMKFGEVTALDINQLMDVAMRFLPTIFSLFKTAKWKWDSLDFVLSNDNYNQRWWEYSLKYQGVCPPVRRTEENFDPATSRFLANSESFVRHLIAIIYGFQFYEAACKEAGHTDLLHRCNLYGDKALGDKLNKIFTLGKTINGSEAISIMTNGESDKMDTKPLLEYFRPLYDWLKKENEGETVGWKSDDPMVCP